MRAAQEDKNDTQQGILIKIGRIYWPTITNSTEINMNEGRIGSRILNMKKAK